MNLAYTSALQTFAFRHRHEQGVLRVSGADRLTWLNGLVTNDVLARSSCYAAWLTPQGRMITDMFVVSTEADTLLEVPAPLSATLAQRLDGLIFTENDRNGQPLTFTKPADLSSLSIPEISGPGIGQSWLSWRNCH